MREHYRPPMQIGLRHLSVGKEALKLNFQPKNDRTKIKFIFLKLIWLILLDDRDAIYNL